MLKLFVKTLGLIAILVLSGTAGAVGVGGINVTTSLGEPLNAEIELMAVSKADQNKMSARLATPDAFKGAGLDFPSNLPKLKFQVEVRANGEPYLKVTSSQPVNEPFVSLLVEVTWSSGRLLREYTFLLDPPGFKPEQPKAVEVQPLEPSAASPSESGVEDSKAGAVKEETAPMSLRATAPMDEKVFVDAGVASAKKPAESKNVASGEIKVKRGDTLNKIARETKPADVSLERMLVAMYRANEDAFDGKNMNRLKTGKILRVPEGDDLSQLAQVDAVNEIHAQAADWHAYRLKLAAASGSTKEQAPKQEVSGKISTSVADKTPAAKESAKEVVRLSKGEAPGDQAAAGAKQKSMQDKLHAMEEDATARNKMLKESHERIVMLENNIKEMQRLVELKAQPLPSKPVLSKIEAPVPNKIEEPVAKPEIKLEAASAPARMTTLAHEALPASAVKSAKPIAPKAVTPPPSLLDEILGEPLYLAAGAAVLLGLGGFGFMRTRRNKVGEVAEGKDDAGANTHIVEPVAPSPDTGDFTQIAPAHVISPAQIDDVDPISEADLFLNFGRDKQAEEILKDALKKNPGNMQVSLKLLSIYANRKDVKEFSGVAHQVQSSGDAAAWAQAAEMGRKLEPGNPMYGGDDSVVAGAGGITPDVVKPAQPAPSLDFDLGIGAPEAGSAPSSVDVPLDVATAAAAGGLDFDLGFDVPAEADVPADADIDSTIVLGAQQNVEPEAAENLPVKQVEQIDFDITSDISAEPSSLSVAQTVQSPQPVEKSAHSSDDLVFEVTPEDFSPAAMVDEMVEMESPAEIEDAMEFSLDFPAVVEEKSTTVTKQAVAKEANSLDLNDINLNMDAPSVPADQAKDARWHDVATKLDLARAYQEMGDASGACEILEEVLNEGDAQQRAAAEVMLQQLSA